MGIKKFFYWNRFKNPDGASYQGFSKALELFHVFPGINHTRITLGDKPSRCTIPVKDFG